MDNNLSNTFPEKFFFDTYSQDVLESFILSDIDGEVVKDDIRDSDKNVLNGYYHL